MTVVAFFDDLHIAIADILMSKDFSKTTHPLPPPLFLPSAPNSHQVYLEAIPTRIVRKFFSFPSNISKGSFLAAGSVADIEDVMRNVQLLRSGLLLPSQSLPHVDMRQAKGLLAHAMDISEQNLHGNFEILSLCDGERFDRAATFGSRHNIPYFGNVTLIGSGKVALCDWLHQRGEQISKMSIANESFEHRRHRTGGWLLSRLLEEDGSKNSRTLPAGVGGYYELYEYDKSGILPVDAILTAFISLTAMKKKEVFVLQNLFFHKYFDEHLCILSLKRSSPGFQVGEDVRIPVSEFELSVVPRMNEKGPSPRVGPDLLATMAGNAALFNLSLFRDTKNGFPAQAKRFIDTQNKLIRTTVVNEHVHIFPNYPLLQRFVRNFPKRPACGQEVLYSSE